MSEIMDSILMSTKKMLGGLEPNEESPFDQDIIMQINGVFSVLQQLGIGPLEGFAIEDSAAQWTDFTTDLIILNMVIITYACTDGIRAERTIICIRRIHPGKNR